MNESWIRGILKRGLARIRPESDLVRRLRKNAKLASTGYSTEPRFISEEKVGLIEEEKQKGARKHQEDTARVNELVKEAILKKFRIEILGFIRYSVENLERASKRGQRSVDDRLNWAGKEDFYQSGGFGSKINLYPSLIDGSFETEVENKKRKAPDPYTIIATLEQMPEYLTFSKFCKKKGLILSFEPVRTERREGYNAGEYSEWKDVIIRLSLSYK